LLELVVSAGVEQSGHPFLMQSLLVTGNLQTSPKKRLVELQKVQLPQQEA
jgi:hypothetical protein